MRKPRTPGTRSVTTPGTDRARGTGSVAAGPGSTSPQAAGASSTRSVAAREAPGILGLRGVHDLEAGELRLHGVEQHLDGGRSGRAAVLAAHLGEHSRQLLYGHEHVAGLRSLGRAHDLAGLEEVHEPSRLR